MPARDQSNPDALRKDDAVRWQFGVPPKGNALGIRPQTFHQP